MTIHGKIDCLLPQRGAFGFGSCGRALLKSLHSALTYFATLGICEEVARFNGYAATGFNWHDQANPLKDGAWILWRFPPTANRAWPWYLHAQQGDYTHFGRLSPGWGSYDTTTHPAKLMDNYGNSYENVGIQIARGIGSTNTIWNGSANANGADTKGAQPYWKVPSGGSRVAVLPRSNGIGGAHAATKQNFSAILSSDADCLTRINYITDGDALVITKTTPTSGATTSYELYYLGQIEVEAGITDGAMLLWGSQNALPWTALPTVFGDLAGNGGGHQVGCDAFGFERSIALDRPFVIANGGSYSYLPNHIYTPTNRVSLFTVPVFSGETGSFGRIGRMHPALVAESYGVASHQLSGDGLRAFFTNTGSAMTTAIAWDGVTTPGTIVTRDGANF